MDIQDTSATTREGRRTQQPGRVHGVGRIIVHDREQRRDRRESLTSANPLLRCSNQAFRGDTRSTKRPLLLVRVTVERVVASGAGGQWAMEAHNT